MRTITVKGIGCVSAKPDFITLSLGIESQDREYDEAMAKAAKRINGIENAAAHVGFEKGSLKTISFNVSSAYESVKDINGNYKREFAGYICSYRLKLSFDFDSELLTKVLSQISQSGAKPEISVAFTVKDPSKISRSLLESAAANAKEKAELLCSASGVRLGQLQSIDYSWSELNLISNTRYDMEDNVLAMMAVNKTAAPQIAPDDIDVHDTATFIWEIL